MNHAFFIDADSRMKIPTVTDMLALLDDSIPFRLAETWDNCGLQCGDPSWPAETILVALDVSSDSVQAAERHQADLLLTHHPLLLSPVSCIDFSKMPGDIIARCVRNRLSVISVHTNLDAAPDGLNDYFCSLVGVSPDRALIPSELPVQKTGRDPAVTGIGRVGQVAPALTFSELVRRVKTVLNLPGIRAGGHIEGEISTAAVCTGSGGSLTREFIRSGAQVFITGDIKYHDARLIEENSRGFIDAGHFGSEHIAVDLLTRRISADIRENGFRARLIGYKDEKDPFFTV